MMLLIPVFSRSRFRPVLVLEARWTAAPNEEDSRGAAAAILDCASAPILTGTADGTPARVFAASANPRKGLTRPAFPI